MLLGPFFVLFGLYSLFNSEEVFTFSGGKELTGIEETKAHLIFIAIGIAITLFRFYFMRYRKNSDLSNDIPLPTNVDFEKTDDVNENIRRYKEAQLKELERIRNKNA